MCRATRTTIRNNIFNGTDSQAYDTAIRINQRGVELAPTHNHIDNNTNDEADPLACGTSCVGIDIDATAAEAEVRN